MHSKPSYLPYSNRSAEADGTYVFNAYDFVVLHVVHAVFSGEREVALHDERVIAEFVFYEVFSRNTQKFLVDNESHNFLLKNYILSNVSLIFQGIRVNSAV